MALWFPLNVNDRTIGIFYAQRREFTVPGDRMCTYDVRMELEGGLVSDWPIERRSVIRHKYDKGAFALVLVALRELVPQFTQAEDSIKGSWRIAHD